MDQYPNKQKVTQYLNIKNEFCKNINQSRRTGDAGALETAEKGFLKEIIDSTPEPKPHSNTMATILKILVEKGFVEYTRAWPQQPV